VKFYAALVISAGLAAAQPVSTPEVTVALFGRVTNAQTHDPVRRAFIKIYTAKQRWDELSDSEGRFKFPPLKRAEYGLAIHRDGYTERYYKIELSDFDNPKELPLELFPQGVITGRVVDGFGQPLEDAEISAILAQQKSPQTPVSNRTTDLGEYRLSGLDPGSYQIRATYREGREHEFDATPISRASAMKPELIVKSGVVVEGIDFTLVPARPVTLRGTVHSESGEAVEKATLWIEGPGPGREGSHNGNANNGKFEFADVGPGNYVIFGDAKAMFGSISIQVGNEELNGIDLVLRPTPMIRGTLRVQSGDSSSLGENSNPIRTL